MSTKRPKSENPLLRNNENLEVRRQRPEVTANTAAGYSRLVSTYAATDEDEGDDITSLTWTLSGSDAGVFGTV